MIKVGILGIAKREGTFAEVGLRSWEESGGALVEGALLSAGGVFTIHRPLVLRPIPDELGRVLRDWCDVPSAEARCDLVLTVGGAGFSPRDVVPEVSAGVIERPAPGLAELLRRSLSPPDLQALTWRGLAGLRRQTLIINLPGETEALTGALNVLLPLIPSLVEAAQAA